MARGIGIRDVAKRAEVSVTTVSHVLNDVPDARVHGDLGALCAGLVRGLPHGGHPRGDLRPELAALGRAARVAGHVANERVEGDDRLHPLVLLLEQPDGHGPLGEADRADPLAVGDLGEGVLLALQQVDRPAQGRDALARPRGEGEGDVALPGQGPRRPVQVASIPALAVGGDDRGSTAGVALHVAGALDQALELLPVGPGHGHLALDHVALPLVDGDASADRGARGTGTPGLLRLGLRRGPGLRPGLLREVDGGRPVVISPRGEGDRDPGDGSHAENEQGQAHGRLAHSSAMEWMGGAGGRPASLGRTR
jgi:hypothetical protein